MSRFDGPWFASEVLSPSGSYSRGRYVTRARVGLNLTPWGQVNSGAVFSSRMEDGLGY